MRWLIVLILALGTLVVTGDVDAGQTRVGPYTRRNGTYVQPHYRTAPNHSRYDNWSSRGNINPITGRKGSVNPDAPRWRMRGK